MSQKASPLLVVFFFLVQSVFCQAPQSLPSSEILHQIQKLGVVTNVLYVAAHPDDENTLFITHLSKERKARTAYIAMTRGDGGQNLVGNEQDEYVGLLRTHELLAARSVDGGEQYFTRAKDYGFTKTTDEALTTWQKETVLADLVWRIRSFRPDVMVNRFPPDQRAGHGHHSASAVLSKEAFVAAADPKRFPEQLAYVQVWQPKRLVWNSYSPGFQNKAPEGSFIEVKLGDFNPLLGKSYPEIAAEARSMHKSQGFGSAKNRSERTDFALHVAGEEAKTDLFDGIDTSWGRLKNGAKVGADIKQIEKDFDFANPSKSVPALIEVLKQMESLEQDVYVIQKTKELKQIIANCAGLWFEALALENFTTPGDKFKMNVLAVNRSAIPIKLGFVKFNGTNKDTVFNKELKYAELLSQLFELQADKSLETTQPYWLRKPYSKGLYDVEDQQLRGLAMQNPQLMVDLEFEILGKKLNFVVPIRHKFVEPSDGEIYRYFELRPAAMVNIENPVYTFANNQAQQVQVKVRTAKNNVKGLVKIDAGKGWLVNPQEIPFDIKEKNIDHAFVFTVTPPKNEDEAVFNAKVMLEDGSVCENGFNQIDYKHIPQLTTFPAARAKFLKMNIVKKGDQIGYISGAGDKVPQMLEQLGYKVNLLTKSDLDKNLGRYSAIVVGVRAYNTEDFLKDYQSKLMDYVKNGGNMVVQYQTNAFYGGLKLKDLGPYPFTISNGRVTNEDAEVKVLKPEHPLMNKPNKIEPKDFSGWVQERGLYFSNGWDKNYDTVLSMKDNNENEQEGSLLYAKYGKGNYVFTSLAFFRQLPAGVPGAFRLFTNLISVGK